ncbi:MAG TPA: DUF1566 domain-containing protein [Rhodospirillales bacterium]|nr:DUF1566 domain-containing protein [Rhodospirillales bacterium]
MERGDENAGFPTDGWMASGVARCGLQSAWAISSGFWSASSNANNSDNAWNVNFNNGNDNNDNKSNDKYVRLVRGGEWSGGCLRFPFPVSGLAGLPEKETGHPQCAAL